MISEKKSLPKRKLSGCGREIELLCILGKQLADKEQTLEQIT